MKIRLDGKRNIGLGKTQSHDVGADDHGEPRLLKRSGKQQGEPQRENGECGGGFEPFQERRNLMGKHEPQQSNSQPDAEALDRDPGDASPVDMPARGSADGYDTHDDGKADDAEHVVNHGGGKDRHAFGRIDALLFRQNTGGDSHRGRSTENTKEKTTGVHEGRFQSNHADHIAEHEREKHSAEPDHASDHGIFEKHAQIRFKPGHEQQDNGTESRNPIQGSGYRNRGTGNQRKQPVVEAMQVESDASEQIRTDDNTGNQFTENRGDF